MIVVIADDLSGAAELANAAVAMGLSAEVQLCFDRASEAEVVCVSTGTRSLTREAAAERVAVVAASVAAAGPTLVFQKCDSLLRGNVAAEAMAIARVLGRTRVLLVPANPSRQRIIRGGEYFVDGIPLSESAAGADPEHPSLTSRVAELLGVASAIDVPDTAAAGDVTRHAGTVDDRTLAVGAVDFFHAVLARQLPELVLASEETAHSPRFAVPMPASRASTLFVCGSHAAWIAGRSGQFARRGITLSLLPAEACGASSPDDVLRRWADTAGRALRAHGAVALAIGGMAVGRGVTSAVLGERLARGVGLTLQQQSADRIFLEGGATAAAVMQQLGLERFLALPSPGAGVGTLRPIGHAGPLLFVKPGSYPWPAAILPP